jgi:hypothetical protein
MTREEEIKQASEIIKWTVMARYGFVKGAEWADAHPHWIRVDEQKPPVDEPLLLAVNGFGNAQFGQYYRDGIFRNLETYEYANKVTHWKLFPELPRGRE